MQEIDLPLVQHIVCRDEVLAETAEKAIEKIVQLQLAVPETLNVFEGHFEQAPIVPGVVQIYWALALCNEYLHQVSAEAIERVDALKFQQVIQPGAELQLTLKLARNNLQFDFASDIGRHSSGKVVLD